MVATSGGETAEKKLHIIRALSYICMCVSESIEISPKEKPKERGSDVQRTPIVDNRLVVLALLWWKLSRVKPFGAPLLVVHARHRVFLLEGAGILLETVLG